MDEMPATKEISRRDAIQSAIELLDETLRLNKTPHDLWVEIAASLFLSYLNKGGLSIETVSKLLDNLKTLYSEHTLQTHSDSDA